MSVTAELPPSPPAPKAEAVPVERERRGMSRGEFWLSLLTAILAVATIVLAVSSIIGNKLAMEAVADARETSHIDQRAWLGVTESMADNFTVGAQITLGLEYTNSGKTPATHVSETTGWRFLAKDAPLDVPRELRDKTACDNAVVTPGGKRMSKSPIDHVMTADEVSLVESGAFVFYVFGQLTYHDVFGQTHHSLYCFRHEPGRTPGLSNCANFNDAD